MKYWFNFDFNYFRFINTPTIKIKMKLHTSSRQEKSIKNVCTTSELTRAPSCSVEGSLHRIRSCLPQSASSCSNQSRSLARSCTLLEQLCGTAQFDHATISLTPCSRQLRREILGGRSKNPAIEAGVNMSNKAALMTDLISAASSRTSA